MLLAVVARRGGSPRAARRTGGKWRGSRSPRDERTAESAAGPMVVGLPIETGRPRAGNDDCGSSVVPREAGARVGSQRVTARRPRRVTLRPDRRPRPFAAPAMSRPPSPLVRSGGDVAARHLVRMRITRQVGPASGTSRRGRWASTGRAPLGPDRRHRGSRRPDPNPGPGAHVGLRRRHSPTWLTRSVSVVDADGAQFDLERRQRDRADAGNDDLCAVQQQGGVVERDRLRRRVERRGLRRDAAGE